MCATVTIDADFDRQIHNNTFVAVANAACVTVIIALSHTPYFVR